MLLRQNVYNMWKTTEMPFPNLINVLYEITKCLQKSNLRYTYATLYAKRSSWAKSSICKMVVCCAMLWVTMKLGSGDTSLPLLCVDNFFVTDNLRTFSDATCFSLNLLCADGIPITDRKVVGYLTQIWVLQLFCYYGWQCIISVLSLLL